MIEKKPATSFLVEYRRRLGFFVPEFESQFTPFLNAVAEGKRFKRPASIHHTPQINGRTGQPHTQLRAARRRVRQQERAAWHEFERGQESR
jgi:hypothetical protein